MKKIVYKVFFLFIQYFSKQKNTYGLFWIKLSNNNIKFVCPHLFDNLILIILNILKFSPQSLSLNKIRVFLLLDWAACFNIIWGVTVEVAVDGSELFATESLSSMGSFEGISLNKRVIFDRCQTYLVAQVNLFIPFVKFILSFRPRNNSWWKSDQSERWWIMNDTTTKARASKICLELDGTRLAMSRGRSINNARWRGHLGMMTELLRVHRPPSTIHHHPPFITRRQPALLNHHAPRCSSSPFAEPLLPGIRPFKYFPMKILDD